MHTTPTPLAQLDREAARRLRKEQRLAAQRARRGTAEWRAAGQQLQADRDAAAQAARARRAAERDAARPVTDTELHRAVRRTEAAITEAAADTGQHADVVAHDVVHACLLNMRPALAAEVQRVMLGTGPNVQEW
jgi:hypothetical protein